MRRSLMQIERKGMGMTIFSKNRSEQLMHQLAIREEEKDKEDDEAPQPPPDMTIRPLSESVIVIQRETSSAYEEMKDTSSEKTKSPKKRKSSATYIREQIDQQTAGAAKAPKPHKAPLVLHDA
jgi:hypothetical protein